MDAIFSNISLSNNLSFLAISAIIIPIILHLLNPNKAETIWIAHIDLIRDTRLKRVFQAKWLDKLLLLLRLLIFCLLALMLAEPLFYTLPKSLDEKHIFISEDWLLNATESDKNALLARQRNPQRAKYFQLEKSKKYYYNFINLEKTIPENALSQAFENKKRFKKRLRIRGGFEGHSSQDYIDELMRRRTTPKMTEIYITNREINFNVEVLNIGSNPKYELNVLKLPVDHIVRKPISKLLYPKNSSKQYQTATQLLKISLAALNVKVQTEWLMIKATSDVVDVDADVDADADANANSVTAGKSANEKIDLIFVLGKKNTSTNEDNTSKTIYVKPSTNGLTFSTKNRVINYWSKDAPNDLLQIISQIVESTPISIMQHRVIESQFTPLVKKDWQGDSQIELPYSQSLLKYILFLISLIWLVERRLSLGST